MEVQPEVSGFGLAQAPFFFSQLSPVHSLLFSAGLGLGGWTEWTW